MIRCSVWPFNELYEVWIRDNTILGWCPTGQRILSLGLKFVRSRKWDCSHRLAFARCVTKNTRSKISGENLRSLARTKTVIHCYVRDLNELYTYCGSVIRQNLVDSCRGFQSHGQDSCGMVQSSDQMIFRKMGRVQKSVCDAQCNHVRREDSGISIGSA